jgi:hypothetical protein
VELRLTDLAKNIHMHVHTKTKQHTSNTKIGLINCNILKVILAIHVCFSVPNQEVQDRPLSILDIFKLAAIFQPSAL